MNTLAVFYNAPYLEFIIYGSSKCEAVGEHAKHRSGTCYNLRSPRNFACSHGSGSWLGIAIQELYNASAARVTHAGQSGTKDFNNTVDSW